MTWRQAGDVWCVGRRYGLSVAGLAGPWVSLGMHIHWWPLPHAQIVLHVGWWIIVAGRHYGLTTRGHDLEVR